MIRMGDKLYIVTRRDISPGYQAVQSCHALRQFTHDHPDIDNEWFTNSNYLALLSAENEQELRDLLEDAWKKDIANSFFSEPDIGNQITAIVLAPGSKTQELLKHLPLALSQPELKEMEWHLEEDELSF